MSQLVGHSLVCIGAPGTVHTTQQNPLGKRSFDSDGNEFIYLQGIGSTAIGSWVNYDGGVAFVTALLDTDVAATQLGRLAVATAAVGAGEFGWYQIYGAASFLALTGSTDTKNCFATSTEGSCDDSGAGAEVLIFGAFSTGAVTSGGGLQAGVLNYPFITGLTLD